MNKLIMVINSGAKQQLYYAYAVTNKMLINISNIIFKPKIRHCKVLCGIYQ